MLVAILGARRQKRPEATISNNLVTDSDILLIV